MRIPQVLGLFAIAEVMVQLPLKTLTLAAAGRRPEPIVLGSMRRGRLGRLLQRGAAMAVTPVPVDPQTDRRGRLRVEVAEGRAEPTLEHILAVQVRMAV